MKEQQKQSNVVQQIGTLKVWMGGINCVPAWYKYPLTWYDMPVILKPMGKVCPENVGQKIPKPKLTHSTEVKMAEKVEVSVERVRAIFTNVLGILYNPAPAYLGGSDKPARTREDVPWIIIIPDLSIVTTMLDEDGDPIRGHINPKYAQSFASLLYNRLKANPELLASYQTQPEVYPMENEYMGKLIPITFRV